VSVDELDEAVAIEGLRPDETVCPVCNLTYFYRLDQCPTCKERDHAVHPS